MRIFHILSAVGLAIDFAAHALKLQYIRKVSASFLVSSSLLSCPLIVNSDVSTTPLPLTSTIASSLVRNTLITSVTESELSTNDIQNVQQGFRDFDLKRLDAADQEFSAAIKTWKSLNRPRDEIVSLIKARANVRLDNKLFESSLLDYNEALDMMRIDGEDEKGIAKYPEYPDTFVGRGNAKEGLADWNGALLDYDKAISLWGGGRGEGINPYVLTYRGNVLCRLGKYSAAIPDYEAASDRFISMRDIPRYSDARANLALALYEVGQTKESIKTMKDVIRRNPGYGDMHVAIAADAWSDGNYILALNEWQFVCSDIDSGCKAYEDSDWVSRIRRWPPSLSSRLTQFLRREVPEKLKGTPGTILAPAV